MTNSKVIAKALSGAATLLAFGFYVGHAGANVSTPGVFAVSPTGAATYTIPIQVPPGTAGMEPKLALVYNSQGGNGWLAVGWSISGFSAITRCPRTKAQDDVRGGVTHEATDRYCLDGQRLMAVVQGTDGIDGAEHRTERETFSQVISYGSVNNAGPAWFKVRTKSGQTLEFGNTSDSRIEAQGTSTVRIWALNKVTDTKGNSIIYTYYREPSNGAYYPVRIDYTSNTGVAAFASVRIAYEARPDVTPSYQAGSLMQLAIRPKSIQTWLNTTESLVKEYRLTYEVSTTTQRSRLSKIQEFDAAGSSLPEISLAFPTAPAQAYGFSSYTAGVDTCLVSCGKWETGDVNGDGKMDLIHFANDAGNVVTWLSNGNGGFTPVSFSTSADGCLVSCGSWQIGDVDADGRADLVHVATDTGLVITWFSNGDGTYRTTSYTGSDQCLVSCGRWLSGDVNGDGRTDQIHIATDTGLVITWLSNGDGTYGVASYSGSDQCLVSCGRWLSGDVDGDGKTDLIHLATDTGVALTWKSNGDGSFNIVSYTSTADQCLASCGSWQAVDINGDGKTDFVHFAADTGLVVSWVSLGNGTYGPVTFTGSDQCIVSCGTWQVGDLNGDGFSDLIHVANDSGAVITWLSTGTGSYTVTSHTSAQDQCLVSCGTWKAGDITGDGLVDLVHIVNDSGTVFTWPSNYPVPDLVLSITQQVGGSTTLVYQPLTSTTIYTRDASSSFPIMNVQWPIQVVASASMTDGIGGTRQSTYTYAGAKVDLSGRGFLGFRQMQTVNSTTGLKSVVTNRQDWPYVGLPSQAKQMQANGAVISQADNAYACKDLDGDPDNCTIAAGKRYFRYTQQSDELKYDLNGAFISWTRTNNTFDSYGNATQINTIDLNGSGAATGYSKNTSNIYTNDEPNWLLGRLTRSQVTSNTP